MARLTVQLAKIIINLKSNYFAGHHAGHEIGCSPDRECSGRKFEACFLTLKSKKKFQTQV